MRTNMRNPAASDIKVQRSERPCWDFRTGASIVTNSGVPAASVEFGIANLRFTWYAGGFDVLTSTTAQTDLEFSLAAASNVGFFDAGNRLAGCGALPCGAPGAGIATWEITDAFGVLNNSTAFFNYISDGPATLLMTGSIIEPGGGGFVNIITASPVPEPSSLLLLGSGLFGLAVAEDPRRNELTRARQSVQHRASHFRVWGSSFVCVRHSVDRSLIPPA